MNWSGPSFTPIWIDEYVKNKTKFNNSHLFQVLMNPMESKGSEWHLDQYPLIGPCKNPDVYQMDPHPTMVGPTNCIDYIHRDHMIWPVIPMDFDDKVLKRTLDKVV